MRKALLITLLFLLTNFYCYAQITKGYHGTVDAGYSLNYSGTLNADWIELNTIHGYQVNPYFFVGGGVGLHYFPKYKSNDIDGVPLWKRDSSYEIPLFANLRWTILNKRVTPFVDAKIGHYITNNSGSYMTGGVGCRVTLKNDKALYILASYISTKLRYQEAHMTTRHDYSYNWYYNDIDKSQSAVSLKMGYEF